MRGVRGRVIERMLVRYLALCTKAYRGWPGAHTLAGDVGTGVIRVKRPKHYFDPNNPEWPEHPTGSTLGRNVSARPHQGGMSE